MRSAGKLTRISVRMASVACHHPDQAMRPYLIRRTYTDARDRRRLRPSSARVPWKGRPWEGRSRGRARHGAQARRKHMKVRGCGEQAKLSPTLHPTPHSIQQPDMFRSSASTSRYLSRGFAQRRLASTKVCATYISRHGRLIATCRL